MKYSLKITDDSTWNNFRIWVEKTYFDGIAVIDLNVWRKVVSDVLAQYNARYDLGDYIAVFDTDADAAFFLLRFS